MADIPNEIKEKIRRYLDELKNEKISIKKAILFGSYAKGIISEWSDIDIALVSDDFTGSRFSDKNRIRKVTLKAGSDIEVLPFNSADFNKDNPFVKEILETGIEITL